MGGILHWVCHRKRLKDITVDNFKFRFFLKIRMCNVFSPTCILYPSAIFFLLALSANINVQAIHANISSLPKVSFISLIEHLYHLIFPSGLASVKNSAERHAILSVREYEILIKRRSFITFHYSALE